MGAFFESALLFSLAVLIILIGLLVYYFKGRVVELEQKNTKCLEIINDVYGSHCLLKQTVTAMLMEAADDASASASASASAAAAAASSTYDVADTNANVSTSASNANTSNANTSNANASTSEPIYSKYIDVEIEDDIDDSSRVSYTDDETDNVTPFIKTIHVNLDTQDPYELDVEEMYDNDEDAYADDDDDKISVHLDETAPEIQVVKTDNNEQPNQSASNPATTNDYKKMSVVALRGYIISNGIQTDASKLRRMNKQELISLIDSHSADQ
jgi:hypothetical protein